MSGSIAEMFDLSGKVALLTGAGRGIGLGMAKALASARCAIALQDIEPDVANTEVAAINQSGGKAIAYGGDIRDMTLPARLIADVVRDFGRLDVLVNNASIQESKHWTQVTAVEIQEQLSADLVSPILFIQEAWKIFKAQKFGRIINIGSVQQRSANPGMFPYAISKGGLEKITLGLCRELAEFNVTINQIAPGWINTHRNRDQFPSAEVTQRLGKQHVPIGRVGTPDDFRGVILLLCSDAGSYITGQNIFVDGAFSAKLW